MRIRHLLFYILFSATCLHGWSQDSLLLKDPVPYAIEHLELNKAEWLNKSTEDSRLQQYYSVRIAFLRYLVFESQDHLSAFLQTSKQSIQSLHDLPDADALKNVLIAEAFFLRGVAKALDKRYISSTLDFKSACNLISQNNTRFPDNVDQLKLMGIFHVAMSAIPRKLQWLSNVLCFKGDLYTGIEMLEKVKAEGELLPNEALILLFYFNKNILDDPVHGDYAKAMCRKNPESIVYNYMLLSSYLELRENDAAIDLCEEWEKRQAEVYKSSDKLPIWHYSCGKAYFFKLRYKEAVQEFDRFMDHHQGRTLVADALYRKGMSYILAGYYQDSRPTFHKLTQADASGFDADEYASQMAAIYLLREPSDTDKTLYEARNLFDGGYYEDAEAGLAQLLQNKNSLSENHRTELYYRLGRIDHAQKKLTDAKAHYETAVAAKPGRSLWMKVYAHYYLGQIAFENGDLSAAEQWYKTALSFHDYPYQSGLEQRCKAGLARVKKEK